MVPGQLDLFGAPEPARPERLAAPEGFRLGTSGWSYEDWVGPFYPRGLGQSAWLEAYAEVFDTVEIDSTFYAAPSPRTVKGWRDRTPSGFAFAAKFPRAVTHDRGLVAADAEVASFLGAIEALGDRLGPLLVQLPGTFRPSSERRAALEAFLRKLPKGFRYAVELRDRRWFEEPTYALLREHGVALALCDYPGLAAPEVATAPFVYLRLIGDRAAVSTFEKVIIDRAPELDRWAGLAKAFRRATRDLWAYANNHYAGHGPQTIRDLARRLV